jgi:hypothetical protein
MPGDGTRCPPNRPVRGPRRQKNAEAVPQLPPALPARLTQQGHAHAAGGSVQGLAQDEPRRGFLPVVRRRRTACGGPPGATVPHPCDHFYLYGAVEPPPGASFFLALPYLNSRALQRWVAGFAATFPEALPLLVLDKGAGHTAQAVCWPPNVVPLLLPP